MPNQTHVTVTIDGQEMTYKDAGIMSEVEANARDAKLREQAPKPERLTDGSVSDIDELITLLQEAKDRGVESVKVNDDGQTRPLRPTITNNYWGHGKLLARPAGFWEWIEL